MFFFTVTNVRKKGSMLLKLALVLVLVAVLIPYVYGMMVDVDAMNEMQTTLPAGSSIPNQPEQTEPAAPLLEEEAGLESAPPQTTVPENEQQQGAESTINAAAEEEGGENIQEEQYPGEPVRVDGELWLPLTYWQDIATILSY